MQQYSPYAVSEHGEMDTLSPYLSTVPERCNLPFQIVQNLRCRVNIRRGPWEGLCNLQHDAGGMLQVSCTVYRTPLNLPTNTQSRAGGKQRKSRMSD
jgi:hypothetical protein